MLARKKALTQFLELFTCIIKMVNKHLNIKILKYFSYIACKCEYVCLKPLVLKCVHFEITRFPILMKLNKKELFCLPTYYYANRTCEMYANYGADSLFVLKFSSVCRNNFLNPYNFKIYKAVNTTSNSAINFLEAITKENMII